LSSIQFNNINTNNIRMSIPPNELLVVHELTGHDVVLGRGTGPNEHEGNVMFRSVVMSVLREHIDHQEVPTAPTDIDIAFSTTKSTMARRVVDLVHQRGGKFVRKLSQHERAMLCSQDSSSALYVVVPTDVAVEKAKQSFRHQKRVLQEERGRRPGKRGTTAVTASSATRSNGIPSVVSVVSPTTSVTHEDDHEMKMMKLSSSQTGVTGRKDPSSQAKLYVPVYSSSNNNNGPTGRSSRPVHTASYFRSALLARQLANVAAASSAGGTTADAGTTRGSGTTTEVSQQIQKGFPTGTPALSVASLQGLSPPALSVRGLLGLLDRHRLQQHLSMDQRTDRSSSSEAISAVLAVAARARQAAMTSATTSSSMVGSGTTNDSTAALLMAALSGGDLRVPSSSSMDHDLLLRAALMANSSSSSSSYAATAASVASSHNTTNLLRSVFDAQIERELTLIGLLRQQQQQSGFAFGTSYPNLADAVSLAAASAASQSK
jgi:hypothetical protein